MKERQILFSGEMVRAILSGRKTQTRRILKTSHLPVQTDLSRNHVGGNPCQYGMVGDRMWVRETYGMTAEDTVCYRADEPGSLVTRWRPSIHMPRWASRLTLEITGVRVERLNEISEEDAEAEGARFAIDESVGNNWCCRESFAHLWETINGKGSWDANPYVWVIDFKVVHK